MKEKIVTRSCQRQHSNVFSFSFFFFSSFGVTVYDGNLHTGFLLKEHATVPVTVFPCLSEAVEQFKVQHQDQLVQCQDLLE